MSGLSHQNRHCQICSPLPAPLPLPLPFPFPFHHAQDSAGCLRHGLSLAVGLVLLPWLYRLYCCSPLRLAALHLLSAASHPSQVQQSHPLSVCTRADRCIHTHFSKILLSILPLLLLIYSVSSHGDFGLFRPSARWIPAATIAQHVYSYVRAAEDVFSCTHSFSTSSTHPCLLLVGMYPRDQCMLGMRGC